MEIPDIVDLYFPKLEELSTEELNSVRMRLQMLMRESYPDLDYRPNSPLGDLVLSPMSYLLAASEIALGRFMSDLDTGNVAKNIIWNCDYVRRFLKNFTIFDQDVLLSYGIARFRFTEDKEYTIDRRAQYKFGQSVFHLRFAKPGPFLIRAVKQPLNADTNCRNLVDLGGGVYAVDLPLEGVAVGSVELGATAVTDYPIPELSNVTAVQEFSSGIPPSSLPYLAEKTRTTFYAATPGSKGGAVRFLLKEFPDLIGASAVASGDNEMVRDTVNPLGIRAGKMDIFASSRSAVVDPLLQYLKYDPVNQVFIGKLLLGGTPFKIDSVTAPDAPDITVEGHYRVYSRSSDADKAPFASCAYSRTEELWMVVDMPFDDDPLSETYGDSLIPLRNDGPDQVGLFQVTVRQDPLLPSVMDAVESSDTMPFGADVLCRGFIPIFVDNLLVKYLRRPGTRVNIEAAKKEILQYMGRLSAPNFYSNTRIVDAMFAAGAQDVVSITVHGNVRWSLADFFLPHDAPSLLVDYAGAIALARTAQTVSIGGTGDLHVQFRGALGNPDSCWESIGDKNSMIVLDEENLHFSEV